MTQFKYIFIDFDGVLHIDGGGNGLFIHSQILADKIEPYSDIFKIVISSSWRETYDFEDLIEAFEPSIRHTIIGITPILDEGMAPEGRYLEIKKYCLDNNIPDENWVAIDDMPMLFPNNCKNLIITKSQTGITEQTLKELEVFLQKPIIKKILKP